MAGQGTDRLAKKNNILEAFLRKHFDLETFERVRGTESCIVVSEREDKAFKYVFLCDKWIYLTQNPPKKIYRVVHLSDVVRVELVNKFPEFLGGEERENTQHIVVTYNTSESPAKSSKIQNPNSNGEKKSSSPAAANDTKTRTSKKPQSMLQDYFRTEQYTPRSSLNLRKTGLSLAEQKDNSSQNYIFTSRSDHDLWSDDGKKSPLTRKSASCKSLPTSHVSFSNRFNDETLQDASQKDTQKKRKKLKGKGNEKTKSKSKLKSIDSVREVPPLRMRNQDENDNIMDNMAYSSSISAVGNGELRLDLDKLENGEDDENGIVTDRQVQSSNRKLTARSTSSFSSWKSDMELTDDRVTRPSVREAELHLYVLNSASPLLMLMRNARNHYLIRGTLELDPDYKCHTACYAQGISDEIKKRFVQLKMDLFNTDNSWEDVFLLIENLKSETEKLIIFKKLFWKTSELFVFIVKQLMLYLPSSPCQQLSDNSEDHRRRSYELVLVILQMKTLRLMLTETEILPSKIQILQEGGAAYVKYLLEALTCEPICEKYDDDHKVTFTVPDTDDDSDDEADKLIPEITEVASVVIYELILTARQAAWVEESFFNTSWLVKQLEGLSTLNSFLERMSLHALELLRPSKTVELCPRDAVLVYQQFSVIYTLIEYSPTIASYLRSQYLEEFKYFIQGPVIREKFPESYPIRDPVIRLIETVRSSIV